MAVGLSGCADYPNPFARAFAPQQASTADVARAAILAWNKHSAEGRPIESVCTEALRQLEIYSQMPGYDENRCNDQILAKQREELRQQAQQRARDLAVKEDQQRAERAAAQRALLEAQQRRFKQRIADIAAGIASIQTAEEAAVIYHATNGDSLALQPMLKPDGKNYVVHGLLDPSSDLQSDDLIIRAMILGPTIAYNYILIDANKVTVPSQSRIGSPLTVVGTYVGNKPYKTVLGTQRLMPVFKALFIPVAKN